MKRKLCTLTILLVCTFFISCVMLVSVCPNKPVTPDGIYVVKLDNRLRTTTRGGKAIFKPVYIAGIAPDFPS